MAAATWAGATAELSASDPVMARLTTEFGSCTLAPREGGFAPLAWAIVAQQISTASAGSMRRRLTEACAGTITAAAVAALTEEDLRACGLSRPKIRYLKALAEDVEAGRLDFAALHGLDDEAALAMLIAIKGIGRWTAQMYLLFTLNRPDVFPIGDVAVQNAMKALYGIDLSGKPLLAALERTAEAWRPWRSVAVWYLYAWVDRDRRPGKPVAPVG